MRKYQLFTPGPTPVPEEIREIASLPLIHHRTDDFIRIYKKCSQGLKTVFQTKQPVIMLLSSGTGAMEAALTNFLSPGDRIIVINAGKFGERWASMARSFGIRVSELKYPWGRTFRLEDIRRALKEHPETRAVYTQLCETSTGVIMDIRRLGALLKKRKQFLAVDAISGLGALPFSMDGWHADVVIAASQKALMLPPGLAFISYSPKAAGELKRSSFPRYYFDLSRYARCSWKHTSPFTPNITAVLQLGRSLEKIQKEGMKNIISRHRLLARACRAAVRAMGLKLLSGQNTGAVCTAVLLPRGMDAKKFLACVKEKQGVIFAPGQSRYRHRMFRIGHVGHVTGSGIITAVSAVEKGLAEMGRRIKPGLAAAAAYKILSSGRNGPS